MDWSVFLKSLGPAILTAMNVTGTLIPVVIDGMQHAQGMKGANGAQKKAHVLGLVGDAVGVLNMSGKVSTIDPTLAKAAASKGIDATVEALKAIHAVKAA